MTFVILNELLCLYIPILQLRILIKQERLEIPFYGGYIVFLNKKRYLALSYCPKKLRQNVSKSYNQEQLNFKTIIKKKRRGYTLGERKEIN